jgi:tetratricopeptide (TPR) repeat protein
MAARRTAEALPYFTDAYDAATATLGPGDRSTLGHRIRRALALAYNGATAEARLEAQAVMDEALRSKAIDVYTPTRYRGLIERVAGNFGAALELQERALELADEAPSPFRRSNTLLEIGMLRVELRQDEAAIAPLDEVRTALGSDGFEPNDAEVLIGLGRAKLGLGRPADALPLLEEANEFWREFDPENAWAGEASLWLSEAYAALGRSREAIAARRHAVEVLSRSSDPAAARLLRVARSPGGSASRRSARELLAQLPTWSLLSTEKTPNVDRAMCSALRFSTSERTAPVSATRPCSTTM